VFFTIIARVLLTFGRARVVRRAVGARSRTAVAETVRVTDPAPAPHVDREQ
jgi:hypothetical protein